MPQRSQRISKPFDTSLLHQVLRFACLLEIAPDNQPVHLRIDMWQIVWCGTTANENWQGRMLADNGNIFRARRSAGIIARYNDGVGEPAFSQIPSLDCQATVCQWRRMFDASISKN